MNVQTTLEPKLLKISDRLSIRYQRIGNGPALVLMHTIRTQLEYFRDVIPVLSKSYTVFAIDLPGHGYAPIDRNANFDEPYLRQSVVSFIRELQLTDITLVGESIGGALALTIAAAIPERVKSVYAINPYTRPDMEMAFVEGTGLPT